MTGLPTRRAVLRAVCAGAGTLLARQASSAAAEPDGYRLDDYQGETPATLNGVAALTTAEAKALWAAEGVTFVDVLPHAPRPQGLPADTIWREKPHRSIAGAQWLPEVGRGVLAAETEDYFKRGLDEITGHDRSHPLVIFCKRQCWMSWNAAKRAESYGYTRVRWYADGIEGWSDAAMPLEEVQPRP